MGAQITENTEKYIDNCNKQGHHHLQVELCFVIFGSHNSNNNSSAHRRTSEIQAKGEHEQLAVFLCCLGLVYDSFSGLHTHPQVHRLSGNMISPLSDHWYASEAKYFSCIQCSTSLCITSNISKIFSCVLTSHPERRGSKKVTHFFGFLAVGYRQIIHQAQGMGMGRWVWEGEPHPQRVLLAHSLWYVILGLRESSVWIILPFFTFCSHMLSHHHPTLIFMPIKSFSKRIQPHQQCSVRTPCSWSVFIPVMLQNQGTPSLDFSALAEAGPLHRHGVLVQAQLPGFI